MIDRLCEAAKKGHNETINIILTNNSIDPNLLHTTEQFPPIHYAIKNGHLDTVKLLVSYGATIDLNFPIPERYWSCTVLKWIAEKHEWEFLISVLSQKTLEEVDLKNLEGILDFLLQQQDYNYITAIVNQLLVRYILTINPNNLHSLHDFLTHFIEELAHVNQHFVRNVFNNLIEVIFEVYEKVNLTTLNLTDQLSVFNQLPRDLRLAISYKVASSYLPNIPENLIKPLVDLFEELHQPENKKIMKIKLKRLTILSYDEWYQNHLNLFLFSRPDKRSHYQCLLECLTSKISGNQIPISLRKHIIEEIGKLELKEFNKPGFLKAIDTTLKIWGKTADSHQYYNVERVTYDSCVL